MKSPMITNAPYIKEEEKGSYTEMQVLQSGAGYYIGTLYNNPEGWQEPGSRDSDYFQTREQAEKHLKMFEAMNDSERLSPDD